MKEIVAGILEVMRTKLDTAFKLRPSKAQVSLDTKQNPNVAQPGPEGDTAPLQIAEQLPRPKLDLLKPKALASFDEWRDSVIQRVIEVVNTPDSAAIRPPSYSRIRAVEKGVSEKPTSEPKNWYSMVETPLIRSLRPDDAPLITHAMLLLVLSLQRYDARSRTLLLHLCASLRVPLSVLHQQESVTAHALIKAAKMSADAEVQKRIDDGRNTRRWKVGLASVAGALLIGITGGLAAPLVAAGFGTLLGGIGLGGTVAAAYLGVLASSGAVVGSLFGAYGAKMTGEMADRYAAEVRGTSRPPGRY